MGMKSAYGLTMKTSNFAEINPEILFILFM